MKMITMTNPAILKKHALVTGGTSGIGYEIARLLARDGYDLILVARSAEGLQNAAQDLELEGGLVSTISKDLMVPGAAGELFEDIKTAGITIDILVNDAGQGEWGKFTDTDLDREIDLIHLNVIALTSLTKFFLKDMVSRGEGRILQLASSLSKAPSPYTAVYAATKAYVFSLTEALVQELKGTGVTITALQPGATDTDFFHKAGAQESVVYKESDLYDPVEVAKAGYEGLLAGKDKVVPGTKNKLEGAMGAILPDTAVAANIGNQMKPSEEAEGRTFSHHLPSRKERERIKRESGKQSGDVDQHEGHLHESR